MDQLSANPVAGRYSYLFSNVETGTYSIYAGTDSDNDGYIGDAGEAIGAYISLDQPVDLDVDGNLSDLDFATSFNVNLPTSAMGKEKGFKRQRIE